MLFDTYFPSSRWSLKHIDSSTLTRWGTKIQAWLEHAILQCGTELALVRFFDDPANSDVTTDAGCDTDSQSNVEKKRACKADLHSLTMDTNHKPGQATCKHCGESLTYEQVQSHECTKESRTQRHISRRTGSLGPTPRYTAAVPSHDAAAD